MSNQTQTQTCWTCADKIATHKEFRDALGENEFTCDDCHRGEYPEQYETQPKKVKKVLDLGGGFSLTLCEYSDDEDDDEDKTCHTCKKEYEVESGRGGYEGHQCFECFEIENP